MRQLPGTPGGPGGQYSLVALQNVVITPCYKKTKINFLELRMYNITA